MCYIEVRKGFKSFAMGATVQPATLLVLAEQAKRKQLQTLPPLQLITAS
jgi:hypothetical protein